MREIVQRYQNTTTPKGYELRVEENDNEALMWYLCWDDDQDDDDNQPTRLLQIGIARILRDDGKHFVAWNPIATPKQESSFMTKEDTEDTFTSLDDLFTALNEEIAKH